MTYSRRLVWAEIEELIVAGLARQVTLLEAIERSSRHPRDAELERHVRKWLEGRGDDDE